MKSSQQVASHLCQQIAYIFERPLMYGGTDAGVDQVLYDHIRLWCFVFEREAEFNETWWAELAREECGSANLSTRFALNHPQANELEIAAYVVEHWKKIADSLGIPWSQVAKN